MESQQFSLNMKQPAALLVLRHKVLHDGEWFFVLRTELLLAIYMR